MTNKEKERLVNDAVAYLGERENAAVAELIAAAEEVERHAATVGQTTSRLSAALAAVKGVA